MILDMHFSLVSCLGAPRQEKEGDMKKCRHGIYVAKGKCAECVAEDHSIPTPPTADMEKRFEDFWLANEVITGSTVSLTLDKAKEFIRSEIATAVEAKVEEMKNHHFCCKYQTVNPKDFCDYCLSTLQKEEHDDKK